MKTGPAGPSVKETTPAESFKKASKKMKAPVAHPEKAQEYAVKPESGKQEAYNKARERQPKVLRYLRG